MRDVITTIAALVLLCFGASTEALRLPRTIPFRDGSWSNSSSTENDTITFGFPTTAFDVSTEATTSFCTISIGLHLENQEGDGWMAEQQRSCAGKLVKLVPLTNQWKYVYWDTSIASSCGSAYDSQKSEFMATGSRQTLTANGGLITHWTDGTAFTTDVYKTFTFYDDIWNFQITKGSPCCLNCTVYGDRVDAYFWPTATSAADSTITTGPSVVSMLVDEKGFTFTSPSIYVVFSSMSAEDACGEVGTAIANATVAFAPGELKTANWFQGMQGMQDGMDWAVPYIEPNFQVADWGTRPKCGNLTSSFTQNGLNFEIWTDPAQEPKSCQTEPCWIGTYNVTWDPCFPIISAPTQIMNINTAWNKCQKGQIAFNDPPFSLTEGNGMTPLTVTVPGGNAPPSPAPQTPIPANTSPQPGNTPAPPGPTPTSQPSPNQTSSPNPAQNDPQPNNTPPVAQTSRLPNGKPTPSPSPAPQNGFLIGSQTLLPGGPALTISGTTYSLPSSPSTPNSPSPSNPAQNPNPIIVVNGQTQSFIHPGSSSYIIASQWLVAGSSAITVSGTLVSLMPGGSSVVVGGSTMAVGGFIAAGSSAGGGGSTSSGGIGGAILSLGGFATPTVVTATGSGAAKAKQTSSGVERILIYGGGFGMRGMGVWAVFWVGIGIGVFGF